MNEIIKNNVKNELVESPQNLISLALEQKADITTLERLMDLQERWEKNQAKKLFLDAFANFQSELPEIKKSKTVKYSSSKGGNVSYNYSPLPDIVKQIKQPLKDNGFSFRWEFEENGKIKCRCILSHVGGHSESSTMEAEKDTTGNKNDIQSIGSTRTYLQRYTLIGVLGLSTAEDDTDGMKVDKNEVNELLQEELKTYQAPQDLEKVKVTIRDKYVKLGLNKAEVTKIIQEHLSRF